MAASIKCDERPFKGGVKAPPAKNWGVWGAAPPSQNYFETTRKWKNPKMSVIGPLSNHDDMAGMKYLGGMGMCGSAWRAWSCSLQSLPQRAATTRTRPQSAARRTEVNSVGVSFCSVNIEIGSMNPGRGLQKKYRGQNCSDGHGRLGDPGRTFGIKDYSVWHESV